MTLNPELSPENVHVGVADPFAAVAGNRPSSVSDELLGPPPGSKTASSDT